MKRETQFDSAGMIVVPGRMWGPRGLASLRLLLDTGAAMTLVTPEVLDLVGYNPRDGGRITSVVSAIDVQKGYLLRAARFSALGFVAAGMTVHVFDLPERYGFDGLLGYDFLHRFNLEVRPGERRILAERIGEPLAV